MIDYYPPLVSDAFFHIFNRGNNRENIFYKPTNSLYFLGKYAKYLHPVLDTYAYCLLPNHFHLLARVKKAEEILADAQDFPGLRDLESLKMQGDTDTVAKFIGELVSERFRLFFMSYAKSINKQEGRVGSLFQKNFKRLRVESNQHLSNLVLYLHANPQLHDLYGDFRDWTDSSYSGILSDRPTKLCRPEVLSWFGGREQFILRHNEYIDWKTAGDLLIED